MNEMQPKQRYSDKLANVFHKLIEMDRTTKIHGEHRREKYDTLGNRIIALRKYRYTAQHLFPSLSSCVKCNSKACSEKHKNLKANREAVRTCGPDGWVMCKDKGHAHLLKEKMEKFHGPKEKNEDLAHAVPDKMPRQKCQTQSIGRKRSAHQRNECC